MKNLGIAFLAALFLAACGPQGTNKMQTNNPFFQQWDTPHGVPPFEQIKDEHYMSAFEEGMEQQLEEVEAIANNEEPPTFENTIEAFEKSGELLTKVSGVFFNLTSAHTNDSLQGISRVISPKLSSHSDNIFLNNNFYERVKTLFDQKDDLDLTIEQNKLLENYHTRFVRAGAALNEEQKEKMRSLNEQIGRASCRERV